ncbi:MAG: DUF342 domain-containing protein, partial [Spirochaetales bacterium]
IRKLEYEILEEGSKGVLGFGKKDCILIAYEAGKKVKASELDSAFDLGLHEITHVEDIIRDKDGEFFIRFAPEGALVKATKPVGGGRRASFKDILNRLKDRGVHNIDEGMLGKVVKQADGEYVKVGEFTFNPANDITMNVDIRDFEMQAYMTIEPPGPGGTDISFDNILSFLKNNSVIHGIKEDVILHLEDHPVYKKPVLVAEGTKPINGKDARIVYNFETDTQKVKLKEKDGKVDFKELNRIQNVVEGQILAKKIPADEGTDGRTVTGKLLPAKTGRDIEFGIGKNVKLAADKASILAQCNGQVLLTGGKVNVEPVFVIQGDVNMKSGGNIVHLGSVIVHGNVEDGFKIKASGNIEVLGTVGKSLLDAEGDIIVHQGVTGKNEGKIICGKTLWSKFIENSIIDAGDSVVASDGIINSQVDANRRIICLGRGKRAKIVGGRIRAAEEITAESFGSVSGGETILEVGYDPKTKARLAEVETRKAELDKVLDEVNLNIQTLLKLKKAKKQLPEDKEAYLRELGAKKAEYDKESAFLVEEMANMQAYLSSLKSKGKISAAKQVFPGVKIFIKDAYLEVRNEYKSTTFINENNLVKMIKYEEPDEEYARR